MQPNNKKPSFFPPRTLPTHKQNESVVAYVSTVQMSASWYIPYSHQRGRWKVIMACPFCVSFSMCD